MTVDVSNEPVASPAIADAETARVAPPRRSVWRASLGGVLIFAAGAMVGFAPSRLWLAFRDEPYMVSIDTYVVELDRDSEGALREALAARAKEGLSEDSDLDAVLSSVTGVQVLSRPQITTLVNQQARLTIGGERYVANADGSVAASPFLGVDIALEPRLRPSSRLEMKYQVRQALAAGETTDGIPIYTIDTRVDSSLVPRIGVWEAFSLNDAEPDAAGKARVRWLFLNVRTVGRQ